MFAHQIVEALKANKETLNKNMLIAGTSMFSRYALEHEYALERVMKAQHFYLGEQHDVLMHGPGKSFIGKERLFMGSSEYMRLPYRICTFSSHKANDDFDDEKESFGFVSRLPSNRRFAIAEQYDDETLIINLMCHMDALKKKNMGNGWVLQQEVYFVRIGRTADEEWLNRLFPDLSHHWDMRYRKGNVFPVPLIYGKESNIDEDIGDMSMIHVALVMLNCKNIVTERMVAPVKLNRKRKKCGKQELFDYHVLNVVLPKKKQGYHEWAEPVGHNRVHLCRGHFKEYTAEHPLFGHYVGMYWWQPHARGRNREGVVMKDYEIKGNYIVDSL